MTDRWCSMDIVVFFIAIVDKIFNILLLVDGWD